MSIRDYLARHVKLRHLRLIVAIDDAGQMTAAARTLHLTQPALSKALAEIEQAAGERLFERRARGVVATRAGAALIRAARSMLAELDRAGNEIQGIAAGEARTLVVGAMPTAMMAWVGPAVAELWRRDAGLVVRVVDAPTPALLGQLVAGRLHMVVGAPTRAAQQEGLHATLLHEDPMVLVVAPGHVLARAANPAWGVLIEHPWVLPTLGNPLRTLFDRAVRAGGLPPPRQVVEGLAVELTQTLLHEAGAVAFVPRQVAAFLRGRNLARVVRGPHAARLGVAMPVTSFVLPGMQNDRRVVAMSNCLQAVANGSIR